MRVTATEAKNRFGALCVEAKREPVVVEKAGQPDTVILSYEEYRRLSLQPQEGAQARKRRFNEDHKDWIAEQNRHFEQNGLWNEELRTW